MFENNEAIAEFMGLCNKIPNGDHKVGFSIKLNYAAYFGEVVLSSSHKNEKEKNKK